MWTVPEEFSVKLGGCTFINVAQLIVYKGVSIFTVKRSDEDGMLGVDFDVYDDTLKPVARFRRSVVVQGDSKRYDIHSGHDEYVVARKTNGRVLAHVQRRGVDGAEVAITLDLRMPDGFILRATPTEINLRNIAVTGTMRNGGVGILID